MVSMLGIIFVNLTWQVVPLELALHSFKEIYNQFVGIPFCIYLLKK